MDNSSDGVLDVTMSDASESHERTVFCWGLTDHGQLGLGGIEEEQIYIPREIASLRDRRVRDVSIGVSHTVFVMDGGTIYTCGNNDCGQLGHDKSHRKPESLDALETQVVRLVASGQGHNIAVTETGQVFSWGDNKFGQLGRGFTDNTFVPTPKWIRRLSDHVIIQVACGYNNTLLLSDDGFLFSWGSNSHGELGLGYFSPKNDVPELMSSLRGVPVAHVATGAHHCFALSKSGALFGWGKNNFGQLGVGDQKDKFYPTHVKTLRSQRIKYVACGEDHTAALTEDGGVFTFGAGMYGQLGHNSTNNELLPKKVFELMGSSISQIACGRRHTLAYVPSSGRIYAFGVGGNGQLGIGDGSNCISPMPVKDFGPGSGYVIKHIYAGADQCFATVTVHKKQIPSDDFRDLIIHKQILCLTEERIDDFVSVPPQENPSKDLQRIIDRLISSQACLNGSFLLKGDGHYCCSGKRAGMDLDCAKLSFERLGQLPNGKVLQWINQAVEDRLIPSLGETPPDVEALRLYLTLPYFHLFNNPAFFSTVICPFGRALVSLDKIPSKIIDKWWAKLPAEQFKKLVVIYKGTILHILNLPVQTSEFEGLSRQKCLHVCLEVLKKLNTVNEETGQLIPYDQFYIPGLNEKVDIRDDYISWLQLRRGQLQGQTVSFCNYPFVFDAQAKTMLLHTDALIQMQVAVDEVCRRNMTSFFLPTIDPVNPCLVLNISRNNLVHDTIVQLTMQGSNDFKKPLKVKFLGEDAIDEGGVTKEFFLLLIREITDPKYGMFTYHEESRLLWFNEQTFEDHVMFFLVGLVCGLAIYNATIIDLRFPLALFKKLLKRPISLDDVKELQPTIGKSLQQLLDYDGDDVEETFCLNFEITKENFGEVRREELVPGGSSMVVNKKNKLEYVNAYIDHVFNESVQNQYTPFHDAFHKVCGGRVLELFHPQELQAMVVGNENFDWHQLEQNCEYKGEYHKYHPTIELFWKVFRELTHEEKRKFLLFLTGSDRIPIHGMKSVKMLIQPVGGGEDFLPVAHTCFNLLDLPRYSSKEILRQKLHQALDNAQGFALV